MTDWLELKHTLLQFAPSGAIAPIHYKNAIKKQEEEYWEYRNKMCLIDSEGEKNK